MKAAVIYARVSTEEQNTDRQLFEVTEFAKSQGYSIVESFVEKITGKADAKSRKAFSAMLTYIKDNNINQIYSWELSRIGRTMIDIYKNLEELKANNINIHIQKEGIDTATNDENTKFRLNILASVAEYERSTILTRTKSGTHNSIRKGGVGSGAIKQYGYRKDNGKLVIDEEEAAVIREIVDLYLNKNWGLGAIANHLNSNGVETRYRKLIDSKTIQYKLASKLIWTDGSVGRLLHKRLLTGFRKYGATEIQVEDLRILDNDTFETLQLKMQGKRKTIANAAKFENLFKGKLVCGFCGGSMIMHKGATNIQNHYKCYNRFQIKEGCTDAKMINIDLLNNVVYYLTKDFKVDSANVLTKIAENNIQIKQNENSLQVIANSLDGLKSIRQKVLKSFDIGMRTEAEVNTRLVEIMAEVAIEENKITTIRSNSDKLHEENRILNSTKSVDLKNPLIFKQNIKNLIQSIEVKALDFNSVAKPVKLVNYTIDTAPVNTKRLSDVIKPITDSISATIYPKSKRDIIFRIEVTMFDNTTKYVLHVNSNENNIPKVITVGKI